MTVVTTSGQATYTLPEIAGLPCVDDTWAATSTTTAPTACGYHTAVWTGTEMIAWGGTPDGYNGLNTGGGYNPTTDSWTATLTTNAPTARFLPTAVWTGSEMIAWGGYDGSYLNTGGRYCVAAPSPTATPTAAATPTATPTPPARSASTARPNVTPRTRPTPPPRP